MLDYVIKGGTIVDGTGTPTTTGDVGVRDGVIVSVGDTITEAANETIDADGAIVTPGWVDVHTHYDGQVSWDDVMDPSAGNGATTVVMGNCGVGFAPVRPGGEQTLIELMEGVEDIPGTALYEGMEWGQWESFSDYMDYIGRRQYSLDIGAQIAHGAVRYYAMGERGSENEDATAADVTTHQTWAWDDLVKLVGADMATALGAKPDGNVDAAEDLEGHHKGRNILNASPIVMRPQAMFDLRAKLLFHRADLAPTLLDTTATAAAHGLMLHALKRSEAELGDLDHGSYALRVRAALLRDFAAETEFFTRISNSEVPVTPEDYVLVALGLGDAGLATQADDQFYDDELGLYTVTQNEVLGVRPLWWSTGAGELPSPAVWRVLAGNAPEQMVTELTLPFENPDTSPAGDVLLALQSTLP